MTTTPVVPCRSKSPDGELCTMTRGHNKQQHRGNSGLRWLGGINTVASLAPEHERIARHQNVGHFTNSDEQTWMRI